MRAAPPLDASRPKNNGTTPVGVDTQYPRHRWAETAAESLRRSHRPRTPYNILAETLRLFDAQCLLTMTTASTTSGAEDVVMHDPDGEVVKTVGRDSVLLNVGPKGEENPTMHRAAYGYTSEAHYILGSAVRSGLTTSETLKTVLGIDSETIRNGRQTRVPVLQRPKKRGAA